MHHLLKTRRRHLFVSLRYIDNGIMKTIRSILKILIKIIAFILAILLFVIGIIIWFSIGKESLLISVLEIPTGMLFFYLGWRLFRWSSGFSNNYMGGTTSDDYSNEGWHSNDYH
jgi:hypothetical protein